MSEPTKKFFFKISVYDAPVPLEALKFQEPDDTKLKQYLKVLLSYSLIQCVDDSIHIYPFYQVHPLYKNYIDDLWCNSKQKEKNHNMAAKYYLQEIKGGIKYDLPNEKDGIEFDLKKIHLSINHLYHAKKYHEMALFLFIIAEELYKRSYWNESVKLYEIILNHKSELDDRKLGLTYNNLGLIYHAKGKWDKALEYYLKAYKIDIQLEFVTELGATYNNISIIYEKKGQSEKALEYYLKAEKITIEVGDIAGLVYTYYNIGNNYSNRNNPSAGEPYIILCGYLTIIFRLENLFFKVSTLILPKIQEIGKHKFIERGYELAVQKGIM